MHIGWKIFLSTILSLATVSLFILACKAIYGLVHLSQSAQGPVIDYNNLVVVLLTTVTVIFSVFAIVLGLLGVFGFNNLKKDAGKYAEAQAIGEIEKAFSPDGIALQHISEEFRRDDGHFKPWMTERIRMEVVLLLPLVMDRFQARETKEGLAEGEPTDEGITE